MSLIAMCFPLLGQRSPSILLLPAGSNLIHYFGRGAAGTANRQASRLLATPDLSGAVMYASGYPCPMCFAAMYRCGIRSAYFAYSSEDGAAFGMSAAAMYEELRRAPQARALQMRPLRPVGEQGLYEAWKARQS
jgi:tRNA(Arg) A34 adenosine deaminase TadA